MTHTQHTPTQIFAYENVDTGEWFLHLKEVGQKQIASRVNGKYVPTIVKAVNCHDELVEALEDLLKAPATIKKEARALAILAKAKAGAS